MVVKSPHVSVRRAGVIDVVRAVPSATAVDAEATVDVTDAQLGSMRAPLCFAIRNYLARVLGNFSAALEHLSRKATLTVNWRPANRKTGRKFELHKSALHPDRNYGVKCNSMIRNPKGCRKVAGSRSEAKTSGIESGQNLHSGGVPETFLYSRTLSGC